MAGNDKPVIFVSSSMSELSEERAIVRKVVEKLSDGTFETYLFEEDAVPSDETPQEQWRAQLARTQATLALLYQNFGVYTQEEILLSRELGIPVLLFRKKDKQKLLEQAAPEFVASLLDAETGVIAKEFKTPKELKKAVKEALAKEIKNALVALQGVRRSAVEESVDGMRVEEHEAPSVPARSEPPRQLPEQRFFIGREEETQQLVDLIQSAQERRDERYIVLVGPDGIGKEALLRHLTHSGALPEFPRGTVAPDWPEPNRADVEDLLQALWEEFYAPDNVVDPRQRNRQLKDIEALVFLLDLDESSDIREVVETTMPKSVFCGTVIDFDVVAEPLGIEGLTDDEEICAIFEKSYGSEFPDAATRTTFAELCRRQGGNPGKIEYLAKQAKLKARLKPNAEGPHPLVDWVAERAAEEGLTPSSPRLAAAVSEVGDGVHVPTPVLRLVAPDESVEQAEAAGEVEAASPRYRLNPVLEPQRDPEVLADLFAATLEWARTAPGAEIFANRAFVLQMMSRGVDDARWDDVVALGRATEGSIALGARHGAWKELLENVGRAAREIGDDETLSWALHQLGSRALLRDELRQGRGYLHQSLQYREDDEDARELTRHNLMLMPAAVIPFAALVLVPIFLLLVLAALLVPEERDLDANLDFGTVPLPTERIDIQTEPFEVWGHTGESADVTVTIYGARFNEAVDRTGSAFCLVVDGECVDGEGSASVTEVDTTLRCPSTDQEPCVVDVGFRPDLPGSYDAKLRVETSEGSVEGRLTGTATVAIVEISPDYAVFPAETNEQTFTITNVGTTSIDVGDPTPRPIRGPIDGVFDIGALECTDGRTLEPERPDQTCEIVVRYLDGEESAFLEFEFSVAEGNADQPVGGDERVLLIAGATSVDG